MERETSGRTRLRILQRGQGRSERREGDGKEIIRLKLKGKGIRAVKETCQKEREIKYVQERKK